LLFDTRKNVPLVIELPTIDTVSTGLLSSIKRVQYIPFASS
jgi:hypothetical protein